MPKIRSPCPFVKSLRIFFFGPILTAMQRANDWEHFFYIHRHDDPRPSKRSVAEGLGIHPSKLSRLITASRDEPVSDRLVGAIAALWNRSAAFVRVAYPHVPKQAERKRYVMDRYVAKG